MPTLSHERLRDIARRLLAAAGAPDDTAAIVADHLVDANLAGHDSHGVLQLPSYLGQIRERTLDPAARPRVVREHGATATVDAGWGFGHVAARRATELAAERARQHGVAAVAVVRVNHIGRLGEYATLAARLGAAAFVTVGGAEESIVAPHGGARGALGTNPVSFGFPTGRAAPFLVDFATSTIAGGKLLHAQARGEPVPAGALLDREGRPTTDPAAWLDGGALTTFGGHKGSALAVMVALFAGVLTGGSAYNQDRPNWNALVVAIDAGAFGDAERIAAEADVALAKIKAVPPLPGFDEVLLPGEPEARARTRRLAEGVPVPDATWADLEREARELGVTP
jgi:LDH2 family malate/lactate/ureidoglycolate dehydrogenase